MLQLILAGCVDKAGLVRSDDVVCIHGNTYYYINKWWYKWLYFKRLHNTLCSNAIGTL